MPVRNRFNLIVILVLFLSGFRDDPKPDFRKEFGSDYTDAEGLATKLRPLLSFYAKSFNEDPAMLESIVFPELIRYNKLYDFFETGSLALLYSRFGSDYANFSIGYFQMKPDFAKSLEEYVDLHNNESWTNHLELGNISGEENFDDRMDRVRRLQDSTWQLRYLIAFVKSCRIKHGISKETDPVQQLRFLATAYNAGWQLDTRAISQKMDKKFFHLEHFSAARTYNYADIAEDRFKQLQHYPAALP